MRKTVLARLVVKDRPIDGLVNARFGSLVTRVFVLLICLLWHIHILPKLYLYYICSIIFDSTKIPAEFRAKILPMEEKGFLYVKSCGVR